MRCYDTLAGIFRDTKAEQKTKECLSQRDPKKSSERHIPLAYKVPREGYAAFVLSKLKVKFLCFLCILQGRSRKAGVRPF